MIDNAIERRLRAHAKAALTGREEIVGLCFLALKDLDEEERALAKEWLRGLIDWFRSYDIELGANQPSALAVDACLVILANLGEADRAAVWVQLEKGFDFEDGVTQEEGSRDLRGGEA
jgi:hypothetical protein